MKGKYFDSKKPEYNYAILILVEGQDDAIFLDRVLEQLEVEQNICRVIVCGGKSSVWTHLSLVIKSAHFSSTVKSLAVIVDADNNADSCRDEAIRNFEKNGLPRVLAGDTEIANGKKFSFYSFPRPKEAGSLEDLALEISPESEVLSEAQKFIELANSDGELNKLSKRTVQAYLAGASANLRPTVGWAFYDNIIPFQLDSIPEFSRFVRNVVELEWEEKQTPG
ncbi:DUF3226 domain-containing protein [Paracoccus saliphilus]|uniref:Uncharacterized protein n=1 Tax=Paracoccus saliphilus TaxID=405559 RepID=A0AA46A7B5_9RHOB|nr:DUF3226 domain-containing protein [Paracoccus saliphilus]WCR04756.1 hypothetical protein JHX88_08595 [Paracoccus saliphilus]SIT10987.1 hypothetical protein SAMN05421772_11921 [Paracoccus saliphilus]